LNPASVETPYTLGMSSDGESLGADGWCELCGRRVDESVLTRHHLLPRSRARRMRRRKRGRRVLRRRDPALTINLCRPCHRNVHAALSNEDLGRRYDTLEALSAHPEVRRFTEWVRSKRHGTVG
jgi:hypothetical protein